MLNIIFKKPCVLRYKTIFRRKNCRQTRLNNNEMSINNTITEDNINGNNNPKIISQNCDTEFINGKPINQF